MSKELIAAVVTPMRANGDVNIPAVDKYAEFLIRRGVTGAFVCGTTGEGLLMDNDERKAEAEAWMKYSDRLKILVHVGSTSYKLSCDLAAHAESVGAHGISAMGPCFLQPSRALELVAFNKIIAGSAPNTPYYYYHIPATSGVKVGMVEFLKLAKDGIPSLKGLKYTSLDLMEEQEVIDFDNGRYDILHGKDELFLSGLVLGARGAIGTSYNLTSGLYNRLIEEFQNGNLEKAREIQAEANRFIHLMCDMANAISGIKAMLNVYGIDCGPCRLPLRNLTPGEVKDLEQKMKGFPWI